MGLITKRIRLIILLNLLISYLMFNVFLYLQLYKQQTKLFWRKYNEDKFIYINRAGIDLNIFKWKNENIVSKLRCSGIIRNISSFLKPKLIIIILKLD